MAVAARGERLVLADDILSLRRERIIDRLYEAHRINRATQAATAEVRRRQRASLERDRGAAVDGEATDERPLLRPSPSRAADRDLEGSSDMPLRSGRGFAGWGSARRRARVAPAVAGGGIHDDSMPPTGLEQASGAGTGVRTSREAGLPAENAGGRSELEIAPEPAGANGAILPAEQEWQSAAGVGGLAVDAAAKV